MTAWRTSNDYCFAKQQESNNGSSPKKLIHSIVLVYANNTEVSVIYVFVKLNDPFKFVTSYGTDFSLL